MALVAADPRLAVAAFLKAQAPVNEITEGRIFRPELPEAEDVHMPRACLIVRPAGGGTLFARDRLPVVDSRIDIVCYGSSRLEAESVAQEAAYALRNLEHSKWEKVILFWVRVTGQPASAVDPETNWPFAVVVAQVMHSSATMAS